VFDLYKVDKTCNFDANRFMIDLMAGRKCSTPTLTHVLRSQTESSVCAVTILGDELFIVRACSKQVEVYNATSWTFQRHITIPETGSDIIGLAACAKNHCLYLSHRWYKKIQRVDLLVGFKTKTNNAVKNWSVSTQPAGLSVNSSHNVLVACCGENKLQEYTTHGTLVKEIHLQAGMTDQWQTMQLSSGNYVVTTLDIPLVSIIGVNGQVLHSYGEPATTSTIQIRNDHPWIQEMYGEPATTHTVQISNKKLSYRRETARQLHMTTWAGQLTF